MSNRLQDYNTKKVLLSIPSPMLEEFDREVTKLAYTRTEMMRQLIRAFLYGKADLNVQSPRKFEWTKPTAEDETNG